MVMVDATTMRIPKLTVELSDSQQGHDDPSHRHHGADPHYHRHRQQHGYKSGLHSRSRCCVTFESICAQLNTALGLRPDREAFSTLLGDIGSI